MPNFYTIAISWNSSTKENMELGVDGTTIFYKTPEHLKLYFSQWKKNRAAAESRSTFMKILKNVQANICRLNTASNIQCMVPKRHYLNSDPQHMSYNNSPYIQPNNIPPHITNRRPRPLNHSQLEVIGFNPMIPQIDTTNIPSFNHHQYTSLPQEVNIVSNIRPNSLYGSILPAQQQTMPPV
ncbi:hypothetical protein INT47_003458 [Mucor saturninus]|uniref:Uncharacterized protein n=1 Tax=Mucor saturninus TaxID=64648 RepID=A0A8H7V927_9FUNG|nr:hypothetical protein INT47_003458 [Mucor saturninus]